MSLAPWAMSRTVAFMTIDEISYNFFLLVDWEDRYRYIIELGRTLAPLPAEAHIDANKVQGCASQVWLTTVLQPNGSRGPILTFRGDSDAHIVRGLIAILFALYSGKSRATLWQPIRPPCSSGSACASTLRCNARTD